MSVLGSFYGNIYAILLIILSLKIIILIQKTTIVLKENGKNSDKIERLSSKILLLEDVDRLLDSEYLLFCQDYFAAIGYENLTNNEKHLQGMEMVCSKDDNRVLIKVSKESITEEGVLKFMGSMIENNIAIGNLVYSGTLNKEAIKVVEENEDKFIIDFINIRDIIEKESKRKCRIINGFI